MQFESRNIIIWVEILNRQELMRNTLTFVRLLITNIHEKKQQQNLTKHNPLRREATDGDPVDWLFDLDFFLSIQLKLELLDRQKAPVINK